MIMRASARAGLGLLAILTATAPAVPQTPTRAAQADEIVVTARRAGIPVWRVRNGETTIILVGAIPGVTAATKWDPSGLTDALRQADRVMFPTGAAVGASPFALVGYLFKWGSQGLARGQTLADLLPPDQYQRLVALQRKGVIKPGFEREHPLHLALALQQATQKGIKFAPGVDRFVRKAVDQYKLKMVPFVKVQAKPLAQDLFDSPPSRHVPCLVAAIGLAEAGPAAIEARSQAWAARRVPDVLSSPADPRYTICWPAGAPGLMTTRDLKAAVARMLAEPEVTVAVVPLRMLAEPGGVLDGLVAAGVDVSGPAWKRP